MELQDANLASTIRRQQRRALEFWEKNWVIKSPFCYTPRLADILLIIRCTKVTTCYACMYVY